MKDRLPGSFILWWILISAFCFFLSVIIQGLVPFLLTYWSSLGLLQQHLLRSYKVRVKGWAVILIAWGISLYVVLTLIFAGGLTLLTSGKIPNFLNPSTLLGFLDFLASWSLWSSLSATIEDAIPIITFMIVSCSLIMFVVGSLLGFIQQRALASQLGLQWIAANAVAWAVGTAMFLSLGFRVLYTDEKIDSYDLMIGNFQGFILFPIVLSGIGGSFIKGFSLFTLLNQRRTRSSSLE